MTKLKTEALSTNISLAQFYSKIFGIMKKISSVGTLYIKMALIRNVTKME